jgi:hypothetical protein
MEVFEIKVNGFYGRLECEIRSSFIILKALAESGESIEIMRAGHWMPLEIPKRPVQKRKKAA